jgi:YD repeat-containing protein
MAYDLLDRQTHRKDALNGVSYLGFDVVGNQVLALDELLNPTYMTYDGLNRTTHVKDALGGITYTGYDSRSSVVRRRDADGRETYLAYDVARRLERQWFSVPTGTADAPIYYGYDAAGNLTSDTVLGGVGVSTFEHDTLDRLTKKVTLAGPVYYAYDLSGMRTSVKDPRLESTSYTFDAAGRRVRATVSGSPDRLNYFVYDGSGLMTRQALWQDKVLTYYAYDVAGRLEQLENRDDSFGLLTYFAYTRNSNGAISHIRLAANENAYFVYDPLDRLQWERRFFTAGSPSIDSYYLYDAASNRTSLADLSNDVDYVYDARNLLTSSSDSLTNVDEYTYDASQRMTRRRTAALELGTSATSYFKHDQRDFLSSLLVTDQTGSTVTDQGFHYNGFGERALVVGAQGGSTPIYFAHDGNRLLTERDENGFTYGRYRWGSLLEAEDAESGTNEAPVVDERGSVDKLVGAGGAAVYDRFGKEVSNTLASTTRTRFMPEVFTRMNISQKYSLTPSGLYLPLIAATTVGPGARIGRGLGQGGAPIDWGHDGPPIFGFVPLNGPWTPVPPIPKPVGEGKWVPPVRIARGGERWTGVMWQDESEYKRKPPMAGPGPRPDPLEVPPIDVPGPGDGEIGEGPPEFPNAAGDLAWRGVGTVNDDPVFASRYKWKDARRCDGCGRVLCSTRCRREYELYGCSPWQKRGFGFYSRICTWVERRVLYRTCICFDARFKICAQWVAYTEAFGVFQESETHYLGMQLGPPPNVHAPDVGEAIRVIYPLRKEPTDNLFSKDNCREAPRR